MPHIEVYTITRKHRRPQHRWRIVAANNKIIAVSSESYNNLDDLWNGVRVVRDALGLAIQNKEIWT
jgi:uncharacterized protein YegP (UPF0339 family)